MNWISRRRLWIELKRLENMISIYICMSARALVQDVYEQASIQYHSIRDLAAYTTPRAGLSLWHTLYPLKETKRRLSWESKTDISIYMKSQVSRDCRSTLKNAHNASNQEYWKLRSSRSATSRQAKPRSWSKAGSRAILALYLVCESIWGATECTRTHAGVLVLYQAWHLRV